MKEVIIISGKGGTGKTSITASFACLAGSDVVVADCDVDAADLHLLMDPDFGKQEDFYSGQRAVIVQDGCTQCGFCFEICRFDAILWKNDRYYVDPLKCEGCGYCARTCPENAIENEDRKAGMWFISKIRTGSIMIHARLDIGADNSGKLVAKVKNVARRIATEIDRKWILIDGAPGIGCPVISSLTGADFAVLVTEPTISGFHDLKRVCELISHFRIRSGCIINKADLNTVMAGKIEDFLESVNIPHLASFPFDDDFTESMLYGQSIVEYPDNKLSRVIADTWTKIIQEL